MTLFNKIRNHMKNFTKRGMVSEALPPIIAIDFHGCVYIFVWPRILVVVLQACNLSQKAKK